MRLLAYGLAGVGTLQAFLAFLAHGVQTDPSIPAVVSRAAGTFPSGNSLGGFLTMTFVMTCGAFLAAVPHFVDYKGRGRKLLIELSLRPREAIAIAALYLSAAVQAIALLQSGSRGALLSTLVCCLALFLWFLAGQRAEVRTTALRLTIIALALVIFMGIGGAYAFLLPRFRALIVPRSAELARAEIWRSTCQLIAGYPLGVGPGCFSDAILRFQLSGFGAARIGEAHNDYLQFLAETGLPGFLILLAFLATYALRMRTLISGRPHGYSVWLWRGALLSVIASLLHAFVEFNLSSRPGVAVTFFALVGATLAYRPSQPLRQHPVGPHVVAIPPVSVKSSLTGELTKAAPAPPATEAFRPDDAHPQNPSREPPAGLSNKPNPFTRTDPPKHPVSSLPIVLVLFPLCVLLAFREIRYILADWMVEAALRPLGAPPTEFFWLRPALPAPGTELGLLRKATRVTPGNASAWFALGWGVLMDFQRRVDTAFTNNLANTSGMRDAEFRALVRLAMRPEEIAALQEAESAFEQAVRLAPWNADMRTALGQAATMRRLLSGTSTDDLELHGLRHLRAALWLAPRDLTIAQQICRTLSASLRLAGDTSLRTHFFPLLRECCQQALRLEGVDAPAVLTAWSHAGLPLADLLQIRELPLKALWAIYTQYDRQADAEGALASLEAVLRATKPLPVPYQPEHNPENDRRVRYFRLAVREKARWLLRLGRWSDYRAMASDRRTAFELRLKRELRYLESAALANTLVRLRLQRLASITGLGFEQRLQLCRLELDNGNTGSASRRLAELAISATDEELTKLSKFLEDSSDLKADDFAREIVEVRQALAAAKPELAAEIAQRLTSHSNLPPMFTPALRLLHAESLAALKQRKAALEILTKLISEQNLNRRALELLMAVGGPAYPVDVGNRRARAVDLLAEAVPPYLVGMEFLGGAVTLEGFDLTTPTSSRNRSAIVNLRIFWTFSQTVPSTLEVLVQTQGADGSKAQSKRLALAKSHPIQFGAGSPPLGVTLVTEFILPAPDKGDRLLIMLLDGAVGRRLSSTEDLQACELTDWGQYVRSGFDLTAASNASVVFSENIPHETAASLRPLLLTAINSVTRPPAAAADRVDHVLEVRLHQAEFDPASGFDLRILGPDGFLLRSGSDSIDILSCNERGLVYGAHQFLRDRLGRGFWLPDSRFETLNPAMAASCTNAIWRFEAPAFCWRYFSRASRMVKPEQQGAPPPSAATSWAACNGLSVSAWTTLPAFSHNFFRIYDFTTYGRTHAHWYPLRNGRRLAPTNTDWQICLAAAGVVERAVEAAREFWARHPAQQMFSLAVNDSSNWCECGACAALCPPEERAVPASRRWWSEPYWRFVNTVAETVAKEFPERLLAALAYGAVYKPPSFKLCDNVAVFVCQDASGYFDAAYCQHDVEILRAWRAQCRKVGKYSYAGLASWIFPRYCPEQLAMEIRTACELGITDFYLEDHWLEWIDGPLPWITAQLLWNPWQDVRQLEARFCRECYGTAAEKMTAYFRLLSRLWCARRQGEWFEGLGNLAQQIDRYPEDAIQNLLKSLRSAQQAARGDHAVLARIHAVSDPLVLAAAFSREAACLHKLQSVIADGAPGDNVAREADRLSAAIAERNSILAAAETASWGLGARRALAAFETLARWEQHEKEILAHINESAGVNSLSP